MCNNYLFKDFLFIYFILGSGLICTWGLCFDSPKVHRDDKPLANHSNKIQLKSTSIKFNLLSCKILH